MNLDWAPTIAAVLGSTGLIGLITALITRTRVSRLRRFVDEAKSVKETLPADSKSRAVLDQAIDHATLRLAAVELTRFGSSTRVAIAIWALILLPVLSFLLLISWVSAVGAVNGFAQGNNAAFTTSVTNFYLGIIYVVLGVFGAVFLVQWRREKIMRQAIIRLPVALLTPEIRRMRHARAAELRRARERQERKWASPRYQKRFAKRLNDMRFERAAQKLAQAPVAQVNAAP